MRFRIVRNLVTHARPKCEDTAVLELRVKLAVDAEQNMALDAPVIRRVTSRVLDHAYANIAELPGAPPSEATLALVFPTLDLRPVGGAEWDCRHLHRQPLELRLG